MGGWLSSEHIAAAQKLLDRQFNYDIGGLHVQDPGYAEDPPRFRQAQKQQRWIKILHDGVNHWVTSSYDKGVVKVFDSKWTGTITPAIHLQLGFIYRNVANAGSLSVDICQSGGGHDTYELMENKEVPYRHWLVKE